MDWFVKGAVLLLFAPILIGFAMQAVGLVLIAVLPYILLFAVVVGVTIGLIVGFMLRRQLAGLIARGHGRDEELPIPPPEPVHRPRGARPQGN